MSTSRVIQVGSGSLTVKESNSIASSSITTLDFGTGFDVSESPSGEANIFVNAAELWDTLANGSTPTTGDVPTVQGDGTVQWQTPSGGGVTDHGALTGLSDDDHTQYHNNARGDARYSQLKCFVDTTTLITQTTLSNNCKTVEKTSGGDGSVQCLSYQIFGDGLGKYYFEVKLDVVVEPAKNFGVGVGNLQNNANTGYVGQSANSWAYWAFGQKYFAGGGSGSYPTASSGDVIGVAVDANLGKVWFAVNNTWIEGDPAAGAGASYTDDRLKGLLRAHFTPYATGSKATLNGLSSEFNYAPPAGFTAAFG